MTAMAQKKNNMKKAPFKLKSGNKPSIAKLAGVSPMKKDTDEILDPVERATQKEIRKKQQSNIAVDEKKIRARKQKEQDARSAEKKKILASKKVKDATKKILDARMKKYGTTDLEKIKKMKK